MQSLDPATNYCWSRKAINLLNNTAAKVLRGQFANFSTDFLQKRKRRVANYEIVWQCFSPRILLEKSPQTRRCKTSISRGGGGAGREELFVVFATEKF